MTAGITDTEFTVSRYYEIKTNFISMLVYFSYIKSLFNCINNAVNNG